MRLRLIQKVLEATTNNLQVSSETIPGTNNFRVLGIQSVFSAVKKTEETGVLQTEVQRVLSSIVFETSLDSLVVDHSSYSALTSSLSTLRERSISLFDALQDLIQDDSQETVSFKLPDSIKFDELSHLIEDLKKILEQSFVNEYINGKVDFQGFDRGSAWLELAVGSLLAVQILGGMVKFIQDFIDFQQKHKAKEIMLKDLDVQADARKQISEALKKELDLFADQGIQSLLQQAGVPKDNNELKARFEYSIKTLSQWIERGLEVHPSLTAPPETQRLFPDAERILESMKLLPGNADAD
jgi:hypothetical protein